MMSLPTRRGLLAYAAASPALAAAASPRTSGNPVTHYTNVRDYGAKGNGTASDTAAIRAAIAAAPPGGTVWFPPGTYLTHKTIALKPGTTYRGSNASASVVKQAPGANLPAVLADENYLLKRPKSSSGIHLEDLGINGNAEHNKTGHGLLLMADRSIVRHVLVSFPPEAGIVLTDVNAAGKVVANPAVENRVEDCTVTQPGSYGIWVVDTDSSGRQTDGYLLNNIVRDSAGDWAMRVERAAGWFISQNHVYHCARNGIYLSHAECTYFTSNEVDHFGLSSAPASYYGLQVQFLMGRLRPSVFIGNVVATWEGAYPRNLYTYYQLAGDETGVANAIVLGNASHDDPLGSPLKLEHGYQSTGFQYGAQPGGTIDVAADGNVTDSNQVDTAAAKSAVLQLGPAGPASLKTPIAAGVAGGAAVAGIGLAARRFRAGHREAANGRHHWEGSTV